MQQRNKKIDHFENVVENISTAYHVPAECLKRIFRENHIRSADFSIGGLYERSQFLKHCSHAPWSKGKCIKLYNAFTKQFMIASDCQFSKCYRADLDALIRRPGPLVFISPKYTQQILDDEILAEWQTFDTGARLYQYLNWTVRINKINGNVMCFENKKVYHDKSVVKIQFIVINTELHDYDGNELYMFCVKNDKLSAKAQRWQFVKLLTQFEIRAFMQHGVLPRGARKTSDNFYQYRTRAMMSKHEIAAYCTSSTCYQQLKNIVTGHARKEPGKVELCLTLDTFYEAIERALQSRDNKHNLIPILSILSGKKFAENGDYCIDQVLPVQIGRNWIGVVYRNGKPSMLLYDGYDITNKAILCDPNFECGKLDWFKNNVYKVVIMSSGRTPRFEDEEEKFPALTPMSSSSSSSFMPPSPAAAAAEAAETDIFTMPLQEGSDMLAAQNTMNTHHMAVFNHNNNNNNNTMNSNNGNNNNNMVYGTTEGTGFDTMTNTNTTTNANTMTNLVSTPNLSSLFGNYQFLPALPQQTAMYSMNTVNGNAQVTDGLPSFTTTSSSPALSTLSATTPQFPSMLLPLLSTSGQIQLPPLTLPAQQAPLMMTTVLPIPIPMHLSHLKFPEFSQQQMANITAANIVPPQLYSYVTQQ
eukprot:CAMPEP_0197074322 /NCGR_PEP_ID=MMETSP1384-20130603/211048_1 /TAXON_ID=29189 /ORGANISM="Ammonia sp." /LENGTH=642 /DNA_ID=CAMNT_0042513163 /DNA_START=97 /DNA_END=2025 /DNA_ORIENTATION=+